MACSSFRLFGRMAAAAAALSTTLPVVVQAADAPRRIEEVIVTAERRESTVQDTSISISAFTGEFLQDFGVRNQEDLQNFIPAAVLEGYDMAVRGVGRNFRNLGGDPGIATYQNGIYSEDFYISSTEGGMYDISRIEVLRGPQSTLYGRNAVGGAINFVYNRPTFEWQSGAKAVLGSEETGEIYGYVSGPLIKDKLAFRFTGARRDRDGVVDDNAAANHNDLGNRDDRNYALQLLWTPTDTMEMNLRVNDRDNRWHTNNPGGSLVFTENGGVADEFTNLARNTTAMTFGMRRVDPSQTDPLANDYVDPNGQLFNYTNRLTGESVVAQRVRAGIDPGVDEEPNYLFGHDRQFVTGTNINGDDLDTDTSGQHLEVFDHNAVQFEFSWDLPWAEVKYMYGYSDYLYERWTDEELSSNAAHDETFYVNHEGTYYSHELQFFYDFGDRINVTSGAFLYNAQIDQRGDFYSIVEEGKFLNETDYGPYQYIPEALAGAFGFVGEDPVTIESARIANINAGSPGGVTTAAFGPWGGDNVGEGTNIKHGPNTLATNLEYNTRSDRDAYALYTQVDVNLTDRFDLKFGGSWRRDDLRGREQLYDYNEDLVPLTNEAGIFGGVLPVPSLQEFNTNRGAMDADGNVTDINAATFQGVPFSRSLYRQLKRDDDTWTWKTTLDFNATDDILLYGSVTKGYRSGGFNLVFFSSVPEYSPEDLMAYEIGYKGQHFDNTLQLNAAVYFYEYDNIHTFAAVPSTASGTSTAVVGAPGAEMYGIDMDALWLATDNLTLGGNFSYTPSEYTDDLLIVDNADPTLPSSLFLSADREKNIDSNQLLRVPDLKWAVFGIYNYSLGQRGSLEANSTYSWIDRVYYSPFEEKDDSAPSYGRWDARLTWRSPEQQWTVTGFVNNILDETGIRGYNRTDESENWLRKGGTSDPRMFGLEVSVEFGGL